MQLIKRGDTGPAAAEVRATLISLGLLAEGRHAAPEDPANVLFDAACDLALREFQQSRGLTVDGIVGPETWRSLVASRWRLGDRVLHRSVNDPMVGDDVESDVAGAMNEGLAGVLVRTGKYREEFVRESGIEPTATVDSIADVPELVGA